MPRLLGKDEVTGVETYHDYDSLTNETKIIHVGETDAVIENNKRLQNDTDYSKQGIKQEFWRYASIPPIIQVKWLVEFGIDVWNVHHGDRVGKLLEQPEWKYLKCTTGHHKIKAR